MQKVHQNIRSFILWGIDLFYPLFKKVMPLQTFRYAACGGINFALDIVLFFIGYNFVYDKQNVDLGFLVLKPHIAAFLSSFIITFPVGFYLSRYVVWQQTSSKKRVQLFRYFVVVLVCIFMNYAFLKLFVDVFGWYATPSKIFTSVFVIAFSYVAQRHYSFKVAKAKV